LSTSFDAWSVGEKAREWLEEGHPLAHVADVFPNTFYLRLGGDNLLSVTRKGVRSPVSVNVSGAGPSFEGLVRAGDVAHLSGEALKLKHMAIRLTGPMFRNSFMPEAVDGGKSRAMAGRLPAAAALLKTFDLKESILDKSGRAYDSYRGFVRETFLAAEGFEPRLFLRFAYPLLGMGSGFTPSFDDFVAGFLCMFNMGGALTGLSPILVDPDEAQKRTSWASSRLLDYMQRGLMDEEVEAVVSSFYGGDGDTFILSLEDVVSRGHSSGLDMSVGMVLAAAAVLGLTEHGSAVANVSRSLGY